MSTLPVKPWTRSSRVAAKAAYTAALYTARADLKPPVMVGPEMLVKFREQAVRSAGEERFMTDKVTKDRAVEGRLPASCTGSATTSTVSHGTRRDGHRARKNPGVPGEDELAARGVSY